MYRALKPGGVPGIEEHRAKPRPQDPNAKSGHVTEAVVIGLAESVGFRLVATSEINANPKDTRDHPKGVWALPPSCAQRAAERPRYATIGESDSMTLKFVKPAGATRTVDEQRCSPAAAPEPGPRALLDCGAVASETGTELRCNRHRARVRSPTSPRNFGSRLAPKRNRGERSGDALAAKAIVVPARSWARPPAR